MFIVPLLVLLLSEPDVQSLLDRAAVLPPELHADIILRLIEAGQIKESAKEKELLEEAFRLSQQARSPAPLQLGAGVTAPAASTAGMLIAASDLKLDRLSLSQRILDRMLAVDPHLARDRFLTVNFPHPPAPGCQDAVGPRYEPYFRLLFAVVENGFSDEDKRAGKALAYTSEQLRSLTSPEQITAAAAALSDAPLTGPERGDLANALLSSLGRVNTTWRSFGLLPATVQALNTLANRLVASGESPDAIGRALHGYISRHIARPRCAESASGPDPVAEGVSGFNQFYTGKLKLEGLPAFAASPSRPPPVEGAATAYEFFSAADSQQIMSRYQRLRGQQPRSAEWEPSLRAFLTDLQRWRPKAPETPASWFHERMILARDLLALIPPGPLRDEHWETSARFLADSPMLAESPAEWLLEAADLIKEPEAATYVPRMGDPRLALLFEAGQLLGPHK